MVATDDFSPILDTRNPSIGWVQVVDTQGVVVASTGNVASLKRAFAPIPLKGQSTVRRLSGLPIHDGERVAVAFVAARDARRDLTVLAAIPLDFAEESDHKLVVGLLLVFPGLLLVAAAMVWVVVRRALRPVEAIRSQVASISTTDLSARVPEPAGNDEIARLATTMNTMLERLQVSVERQRRFVGDASHELRSPLSSLRNQLEVSAIENPDAAWLATVADMLVDHDRIEQLVKDLLLLARYDNHEHQEFEPVDLGYLVRSGLTKRPVPVGQVREVHAENSLVSGDSGALDRVVRNLVDNAERHARKAVKVTVVASHRRDRSTVELAVSDDGPGIPSEHHNDVFERFFRLDDARAADAGGSGLGLAIVADVVRAHGGTVAVEPSSPGARIVLRLPALELP